MIEQIRNVTRRIQIQMLQILVDTNFAYSESKFHKSVQTEEHLNQVKVHLQLVQLKEMVSIELMTRETRFVRRNFIFFNNYYFNFYDEHQL
jgi:hypothetical protein